MMCQVVEIETFSLTIGQSLALIKSLTCSLRTFALLGVLGAGGDGHQGEENDEEGCQLHGLNNPGKYYTFVSPIEPAPRCNARARDGRV